MFKCYNRVPDASTNPENMKKTNLVNFCFGNPFSASLWKNEPWFKFEQKLTGTEHFLESQPQRRQESSGFIDLFTVYYAAATQI